VAEISSTRLRAKTVVLARAAYNVIGIINAVIMPQFLNEEALNWGAKTGWFWAGICGLCLVWCYYRLPEPKGRTYGELDVLFEQRVRARDFSKTAVDQFSSSHSVDTATGLKKREVIHREFSEKV
jgi:SP family general alpha glucoside:H+ symporter-like MFS transporter